MKQALGVCLLLLSVFAIIGVIVVHAITSYEYERDIGSYFENAVDMNTPDKMLEQLESGKQAIIDAGLTKDMYGAWIFKKPSNSMDFQFQHIDSIIERIKAVQTWYDQTYQNNSAGTETLGDVYEQKMDNLRHFINEDLNGDATRSDWIAEDTWWIHNHFFFYFWVWFVYLGLIILAIIGFALIAAGQYD